jgi:hypothetical protein
MNYNVIFLPIGNIKPSPENDDLYGVIELDAAMNTLIESIMSYGLANPLILTRDGYLLSGHRRFFACKQIGMEEVPCMINMNVARTGNDDFHRDLAAYNSNREKGVATLLKETLLTKTKASSSHTLAIAKREQVNAIDAEFMKPVKGCKSIKTISPGRMPFLKAAIKVIDELKQYWPLSVRQVHYNILNDPPLKLVVKRSKSNDPEARRYKNDHASYKSLVALLKEARYGLLLPMACLDDPTRISRTWEVYNTVGEFVTEQTESFLTGFCMNLQRDQPHHIEVVAEKNTLVNIISPVCGEYHVPLSTTRGFGSVPCWDKISKRFKASGKDQLVIVIISDYDPEGLELANDAVRTLRDIFGLPVKYLRVGVTREQVDELGLVEDSNPGKVESKHLESFIETTGSDKTWECEALPPEYLRKALRVALESAMDTEILNRTEEAEVEACAEIDEIRLKFAAELE